MKTACSSRLAALMILASSLLFAIRSLSADTSAQIDREVDAALHKLYETSPAARELRKVAKGVLVFPRIVKGGFIVGGQYGEGALRKEDGTGDYYRSVAASWGLQAGVQSYGYALFFMTKDAIKYLDRSSGWEIGVGPSIVIVDQGMARNLTTTTAREDVYAFIFDQKGLMAGAGLQGSKITRIQPRS